MLPEVRVTYHRMARSFLTDGGDVCIGARVGAHGRTGLQYAWDALRISSTAQSALWTCWPHALRCQSGFSSGAAEGFGQVLKR